MAEFTFTTEDGQEGTFDPIEHVVASNPDLAKARVTGYDPATRTIKATLDGQFTETGPSDIELNVDDYAKSIGINIKQQVGTFNTPETAADSSPVSPALRFRLGLANSEAGDAKRMRDTVAKLAGIVDPSQQEVDAYAESQQPKALSLLKRNYEDAKISNGEYVVKHNNVWHKVNAPGNDAGDWTEFAAQNGANIAFGIMGGLLGSVVPGAGTAAGAASMQVVAEGAEELFRYAIERDGIDLNTLGEDMLAEAMFAGAADKISKGSTVLKAAGALVPGGNLIPKAVGNAAVSMIKGMENFAAKAHPAVKDTVASIFGSGFGAKMAVPTTREMLDTPETVRQAVATGIRYNSSESAKVAVENEMIETVRGAVKAVDRAASDDYGVFIADLSKAAAANKDKAQVDVIDLLDQLKNAAKVADGKDTNFLKPAIERLEKFIEVNAPKVPKSTLLDASGNVLPQKAQQLTVDGARAVALLSELKQSHGHVMKNMGAFKQGGTNVSVSPGTNQAAQAMGKLIRGKISTIANSLDLGDTLKAANAKFGATEDAMDVIRGKVFSEARPYTNVAKLARGELGVDAATGADDVGSAITSLTQMYPGAGLDKAIKTVRIMQSGIDTNPWFAVPKGKIVTAVSSGAVGGGTVAAVTGGISPAALGALPLFAPLYSPRVASLLARGITAPGRSVASGMFSGAADVAAKKVVRFATSLSTIRGLRQSGYDSFIQSPEDFEAMVAKTNDFMGGAEGTTSENVMKAATLKSQQNMLESSRGRK